MTPALALKNSIEAGLGERIPGALTPAAKGQRAVVPTGIEALDEVLGGGFPVGVITELVGAACSGRSTAALAYLAAVTRAGSVCAWVDVDDSLDPESVAANGVSLESLLWVRCGRETAPVVREAGGPWVSAAAGGEARPTSCGSCLHPRNEARDMPAAVGALLNAHGGLYDHQARRERKMVGTPGAPNRPLMRVREEQVNSDRMPPRRGENLSIAPRCAEPQARRVSSVAAGRPDVVRGFGGGGKVAEKKPWTALDQALRATDLLLQGGGFSVIVLDLGGVAAEFAWRIPLATWFRFRAACERTQVSLLLLTQHACARSSAELVVRMETGRMVAESKVLTGVRYGAATERSRMQERVVSIRKPPQRARVGQWKSEAAWAQAR